MTIRPVGPDPKPLTLGEKLSMIPGFFGIIAVAWYSALTGFFRSKKDAPTFHLHVAYAIVRKAITRFSPKQMQLISPPTEVIYNRYARSAKIVPDTVELAHGAKGHWVGNKNAKNVIIWYHGGGFCLPANIGYFKYFEGLIMASKAAGKDVAVFVISYTLAPNAVYPTQLNQSVEGLRYLLDVHGLKPSQVFLGGDSAGGNLAVGVLSHLAHPHSDIKRLEVKESLAGTVLIAPWIWLNEEQATIPSYDGGDLVTPAISIPWSRAYLGGAKNDHYTDALDAPASWFETFPVNKILVCGGENEVLLPMIEQFVEKLEESFPNVELFVGKKEAHVAPMYNIYVGDNTETTQGRKIKNWLAPLLQ